MINIIIIAVKIFLVIIIRVLHKNYHSLHILFIFDDDGDDGDEDDGDDDDGDDNDGDDNCSLFRSFQPFLR